MIRVINGDLLEADSTFICHQVNCQGVMGSGVAKAIRDKYPEVYNEYKSFCNRHKGDLLGRVQYVTTATGRAVVNIFAQENFGYDGKCYTDYEALRHCLEALRDKADTSEEIAFPYLMGCHRGGGDWNTVYSMMEEIFENHSVVLYRKDVG